MAAARRRPAMERATLVRVDAAVPVKTVSGAVLGGWAVVLVLLAAGTAAWARPASLSADQQRRVDAGEIVVLAELPPGASESAQGGTAVGLVCAPPAVVWDILVDWPNHSKLYPRVTHAEVMESDPPRVRVRYTLAIGPFSFDVFMDKYPDAARRRSTWRLATDRPSTFFSETVGYWQVDDAGVDSVVTYAVGSRTIVPAFLTRGSYRDTLVSTVQTLRKRAQKGAVQAPDARPPCASGL
jgi:hypothetical protein